MAKPHTHRAYLMTCDEYVQLRLETNDRCGICRIRGEDTKHGFLMIDHMGGSPNWKVRGLLCCSCNSRLSVGIPFRPEAIIYMENAYWKRLGPGLIPEPEVDRVYARWNAEWWRTKGGWESVRYRRQNGFYPRSWRYLYGQYGPHLSWETAA